jgi:hypothetical protein
MDLSMTYPLF